MMVLEKKYALSLEAMMKSAEEDVENASAGKQIGKAINQVLMNYSGKLRAKDIAYEINRQHLMDEGVGRKDVNSYLYRVLNRNCKYHKQEIPTSRSKSYTVVWWIDELYKVG